MQMKVRRGQRPAMVGGKVIFTLDVMADFTREETALIERYKLWNQCVYSSASANANAASLEAGNLFVSGGTRAFKGLIRFLIRFSAPPG